MYWKKRAIPAALVALLFTTLLALGQAKSHSEKHDRAKVLLRFEKTGTVSFSCNETIGIIEQSILQLDGVKNAKIDRQNNGVQVIYDPDKTTPQKIVVTFNKENPDTLLQSTDAKEAK